MSSAGQPILPTAVSSTRSPDDRRLRRGNCTARRLSKRLSFGPYLESDESPHGSRNAPFGCILACFSWTEARSFGRLERVIDPADGIVHVSVLPSNDGPRTETVCPCLECRRPRRHSSGHCPMLVTASDASTACLLPRHYSRNTAHHCQSIFFELPGARATPTNRRDKNAKML